MNRWLILVVLFFASTVKAQSVPVIPYESVPNAIRLPQNMYFGEVAGVAVNSKKHVFVYSRGNTNGQIGRAVQQECRDRSRMPSSA